MKSARRCGPSVYAAFGLFLLLTLSQTPTPTAAFAAAPKPSPSPAETATSNGRQPRCGRTLLAVHSKSPTFRYPNLDTGLDCSRLQLATPDRHRRHMLGRCLATLSTVASVPFLPSRAAAAATDSNKDAAGFVSAGFPKKEYTNSITASRDTNISPLEVYDTIASRLQSVRLSEAGNDANTGNRALDVGAGAGVSTQVIYSQLGYKTIDAIDWSGDAWQKNVVEQGTCPSSVRFYEMDDERFVRYWQKAQLPKYDIIVFNFAINRDKALYFCNNLLANNGLLLAPVNVYNDYWLRQSYQLLDGKGTVLWSANDVGAWQVLFQPDVTQDTCQGIWCAPFNGFQKLR